MLGVDTVADKNELLALIRINVKKSVALSFPYARRHRDSEVIADAPAHSLPAHPEVPAERRHLILYSPLVEPEGSTLVDLGGRQSDFLRNPSGLPSIQRILYLEKIIYLKVRGPSRILAPAARLGKGPKVHSHD